MGKERVGASGNLRDFIDSDYLSDEKPRDSGYLQVYFHPDEEHPLCDPPIHLGEHHAVVVRHEPHEDERWGRIRDVYERIKGPVAASERAKELAAAYDLPLWDTILALRWPYESRVAQRERETGKPQLNDGEPIDWETFTYGDWMHDEPVDPRWR